MNKDEITARLYLQVLEIDGNVFGLDSAAFQEQQTTVKDSIRLFIKTHCPYTLCVGSRAMLMEET